MNSEIVKNLRYKLQKRVQRLNSLDFQMFHYGMLQFFGFLKSQPLFQEMLDELRHRFPTAEEESNLIFDKKETRISFEEGENAAIPHRLFRVQNASLDVLFR